LTATNLIEFFKVLPKEEQKIFMGLAEKICTPIAKRKSNAVLTKEQSLDYLLSSTFKFKNS
jgi:hypothetical protein